MNTKRSTTLAILGTLFIVYWCLEFWYNAVAINDYSWLLWYSDAGFLLVGVALIVQNIKLTYSLFCALFVIESIWTLDMLRTLATGQSAFGLAQELSAVSPATNLYFTLYHALIPIGLLIAVVHGRQSYKYGWLGATIFASVLTLLTYLLVSPASQVNCIYSVPDGCHTIFSFLYNIDTQHRILVGLFGLTVFVFIPTNYILVYLKKDPQQAVQRLNYLVEDNGAAENEK